MKNINRKRLLGLLVSWSVYAGLICWLSYQEMRTMFLGLLLLSSFTTLLALFLVWKPLRTVVITTIAALVLLQAPDQSFAQDDPDPWLIECGAGLVVLGVGVVIIVGLIHMCNRCLPTEDPPVQPPAPPLTNSPPVTNIPPRKVSLALTDQAISYHDVSSMTLSNADSHGNGFRVWFHGTVQSSTNLNDWKNEYTINGWASATELVTVYTVDSIPVSTNRSPLGGGGYV